MQYTARSCIDVALRSFASKAALPLATIKKLRDLSGAPIVDVKKALEETQYDFDSAYEALRLKGLAAADKKATRLATEGLVGVAATTQRAAVVEVNCETDFVARNEKFGSFVQSVAQAVLDQGTAYGATQQLTSETFLQFRMPTPSSTMIEEAAKVLSGSIREKIYVRRAFLLSSSGRLYTYCHNAPPGGVSGLGKIASVVSIEAPNGESLEDRAIQALQETALGQQLAMHVAGMKPLYLDATSIDSEHLTKERTLLHQQASKSGKPSNIVEKIVEGRLKKFYEEFCLLDQKFVLDDDRTVAQVLLQFSQDHDLPHPLTISAFSRMQCGDTMSTLPSFLLTRASSTFVVGYHFPCLDGIFAALVAREKFRQMDRHCRFVPLSSSHVPQVERLSLRRNDTALLLDFAGTRDFIERLAQSCLRVVVVDHHVTTHEALNSAPLPSNVEVHYDLNRCAASLALDVFAPVRLSPHIRQMIKLVEDSDLWRMALPQTRWFRAGMGALNLDYDAQRHPQIFDALLALDLDAVLKKGQSVHSQQSIEVDSALRTAFRVDLGGREMPWGQCLAVEGLQFRRLRSDIGNVLAHESHRQGMRGIGVVAYCEPQLHDRSKIKVSFRSIEAEDTTTISVALGGGGHKNASSCVIGLTEFQRWRLR